jgi:uncharacterized protein YjbI with pentapeptide repeats
MRLRLWAPIVGLLVLGGFVVAWVLAPSGSKTADLAANGVGGALVAAAILVLERSLAARDQTQENLRLLASETRINGLRLDGADLTDAYASYRTLDGVSFAHAKLKRADFAGASLVGANFEGADLSGANLRFAIVSQATLRGADLRGADLGMADLQGADLSDANLDEVNFFERMGGSPIIGAHLVGVALYGADLRRVCLVARDNNFEGHVARVSLDRSVANEATRWPPGFSAREAGVRVLSGDQREPHTFDRAWNDPGWVDAGDDPGSFKDANDYWYEGREDDARQPPVVGLLRNLLDEVRELRANGD